MRSASSPQDLTPQQRGQLGLEADEGVRIAAVQPGPASRAGLRPGDVVLSVGRTTVASASQLNRELAGLRDGQTVMLLVRRGTGTQYMAVTAGS